MFRSGYLFPSCESTRDRAKSPDAGHQEPGAHSLWCAALSGCLDFRYVSCGHPPFFLIRGQEIIELPEPCGTGLNLPMAVMPGMAYSAGEFRRQPGDKLVFYTDGLNEMPLRKRKAIITRRQLRQIIGTILKRDPQAPVFEIMHAMLGEIAKRSGEDVVSPECPNGPKNSSGDDITILGLEVEAPRNYRQQVWKPQSHDDVCRLIEKLYANLKAEWQQHGRIRGARAASQDSL